jgi:hypothetical protein
VHRLRRLDPECPVEAIFPEDALPEKWEPFVKISYAYGEGAETITSLSTSTTSRTRRSQNASAAILERGRRRRPSCRGD